MNASDLKNPYYYCFHAYFCFYVQEITFASDSYKQLRLTIFSYSLYQNDSYITVMYEKVFLLLDQV